MIAALGPHAGFIVAAYAVTALVLAGLIAATLWRHRRLRRRLADFEARGIRRRSARRPSTLVSEPGGDA